ncbi:MAG: hypothetical protein AAGG48_30085 [Planctomycetota bacterium]
MRTRFTLSQILASTALVGLVLAVLLWSGLLRPTANGVWVVTSIDDSDLAMCHGTDQDGNETIWDEVTFVAVCRDGYTTLRLPMGVFMYEGCYTGSAPKLELALGDRFRLAASTDEMNAIELDNGTVIVPES